MQNSKVKICGITNLADARFTAGAQADYMGFIFYDKSPRFIEPAKAGAIINWIDGPQCVGVFVNHPLDDVNMIARQTGIDIVQLHGDEPSAYCQLIQKPIIKVIHVTENATTESIAAEVEEYESYVDYLLFDTGSDEKWGGTGQTFDWSLLRQINRDIPFFLSGGINAENVRQAYRQVKPYGIDLASSVEQEPGIKDFNKIEAFMDQMRHHTAG